MIEKTSMTMETVKGQREVRIEYMRLDEIQRDPDNPKDHDLSALAESLERFGFVSPMGINEKTGRLLWGHGRLDDLVAFMNEGKPPLEGIQINGDGMWMAPVVRGVHLDPKDGTAYLIADNRQVELGGWNESKLVETLISIAGGDGFGLHGTGFDGDDVDTLIRLYRPDLIDMPEDPGPQIDRAAELQEKWQVERGQIWKIGWHRLMCGDSTNADDMAKLINGEKVGMVFSDPPYGISLDTDYSSISGGWSGQIPYTVSKKYDPVVGDDEPFEPNLILNLFADVDEIFLWGADYYSARLPSTGSWIVWDKTGGHQQEVVGSEFELCWSKQKHRRVIISSKWAGVIGLTGQGTKSRVHPTQKPIEICIPLISKYSDPGAIIWDGYVGSGTTLVACEKIGRRCFGMEIEPKYCAVTLERMVGMGLEPLLLNS